MRQPYIVFFGLVALACLMIGCATSQPKVADLHNVIGDSQSYKNEYVRITGYVIDFKSARGDTYRTLNFTLGFGPDEKMAVTCSGYTAEAISKASQLVGDAYDKEDLITVTGKVKVESKDSAASELRLKTVEYGGRVVDVTRGRRTQPGFSVGGFVFSSSVGVGATITP